jgi:hypothetical protein
MRYILMIFFLICYSALCNSNILPISADTNYKEILVAQKELPIINLTTLNIDSLLTLDEEYYSDGIGKPFKFGQSFKVDYSLLSIGMWENLYNGDKLWRLRIKCNNAYSLNFIFEDFYLPEGSKLFLYNTDMDDITGPFTDRNNKSSEIFSTKIIRGNEVIIEYYEPSTILSSGNFSIKKIVAGYKDVFDYLRNEIKEKVKSNKTLVSEPCNRDVNCPEGDDFCREKYSIGYIVLERFLCTGSLLNNMREDYTPYLLTAFHCIDIGDPNIDHNPPFTFDWDENDGELQPYEIDNAETWNVTFVKMKINCGSGSVISTDPYSGTILRAAWHNTDFALVELENQPLPGDFGAYIPGVYFNGWDRTGYTPSSTSCLHHPSGDVMKISVDDDASTIGSWNGTNNHWIVDFESGTVEPGSSGSPLYNQNNRVVGQLHGLVGWNPNLTFCEQPRGWYGRLSLSWNGGGTSSTRLKDWLDPDNTNATTLDGIGTPINCYGRVYFSPSSYTINAWDVLSVGSGLACPTLPFRVESTTTSMTLKAGREIVIRPCTQILEGSDFHAYIDNMDCDDIVFGSDSDSRYTSDCGMLYPAIIQPEEDSYSSNIIDFNDKSYITNIPNPFANETEIRYGIENPSSLKIFVSDIFGEIVKVIVDSENHPTGSFSVTFDASELPNGTYYYTMQTNDKVITKKMVVLR